MSELLLQPKLAIPPLRAHLVPRHRLIAALNLGLERGFRLTLVSAPAGFGKTTLLSQWARQCDSPVAWLSLEDSDDDPDRFLAYLVAAIQRVAPGARLGDTALAMRQATQQAPLESSLISLLNDITEDGQPFSLILDDYHTVAAQLVHDCVRFFLDHLPAHVHLFIATRADPPLGLARMRARFELNEVRLDDLRFTSDEVQEFLASSAIVPLSREQIVSLEKRTEGWAAGLQLAALSLRGTDDPGRFIIRLSGADRYIFDYLAEEVLSRQTPSDQHFLMATSVLDRLNGPLCDAVTGGQNGQLILERLEASNLFILPLDNERSWYRYHQLFSGFLRDRLAVLHADQLLDLHHRAAVWFASEGDTQAAVYHFLAAGDHHSAATLVEDKARDLLTRGEVFALTRWIEAMPADIVRSRPKLCLALSWGKAMGGDGGWQNVVGLIADAARGLGIDLEDTVEVLAAGVDDDEKRLALCDLAIMQGFLTREAGDFLRAVEIFEAVLTHRPERDPFLGAIGAGGLGSLYIRLGDARRAERAFRQAARSIRQVGGLFGLVLILSMLGAVQAWQGQLHRAVQTLRQAMEAATDRRGRPLPFAGQAAVSLARVLLEQNDLDAALGHVRQGLELSRQVNDFDGLLDGNITLARVLLATGDQPGAFEAMGEAEKAAIAMESSVCAERVTLWRVNLHLACGNIDEAARWATSGELETLTAGSAVNAHGEITSLTYARLLFAQGRPEDALVVLEPQLPLAERDGRVHHLLQLLIFRSILLSALNRRREAIRDLARAMLLAEPEGYVRIFVDAGPRMASLLRTAATQGHSPNFVQRLLAAFGQSVEEAPLDPLSERELDVLRLMADGLNNPQIAEALTIALSTVKTHINRIYGKLDVRSRTQAVAQARKMRLID